MSGFVFGSLCRMLAGQEIFYMTQKAREEVSAEDAKESAELTQQLAVGTLHSTMDLNDCELLLAPSGGPAWPIEPKDDFTGQKTRSSFLRTPISCGKRSFVAKAGSGQTQRKLSVRMMWGSHFVSQAAWPPLSLRWPVPPS